MRMRSVTSLKHVLTALTLYSSVVVYCIILLNLFGIDVLISLFSVFILTRPVNPG